MISCKLEEVGNDDLLVVRGGTHPHIGAVVTATYYNGNVTIHSHGLPHHKEEDLFVDLAKVWCDTFQKTTVILGGIHIDNATKEQIQELVSETWTKFNVLLENHRITGTI